jgi:hypothetical protein
MTITVSIFGSHDHTFNCVNAVTFHSGPANTCGLPVAEWTRYAEEGHSSEQLVNVDLSALTLDFCEYIDGILCVFAHKNPIVNSRFTDPAYKLASSVVARSEKAARRNVRN